MARILQAFQLNPSLGGFGNETGLSFQEGDCDAFAQIVKELVDNAVDACRQDSENRIHRVRVEFHQISTNILRVTVTDNGCGMACIQDCVEAFRSSKRPNDSSLQKTSGRYGIGLTLCLLHAQRLVPNSTALITSATKLSHSFQRAEYVVDTVDDCVKCIHKEETLKSRRDESGTSISILVPGGVMAHKAWPRLAEYFARFQLSLSLPCSLEVMAPILSTVPLFVRSSFERKLKIQSTKVMKLVSKFKDDEEWNLEDENENSDSDSASSIRSQKETREELQRAVSQFLKCNISLSNIAHSIQSIKNGKRRSKTSPTLEVDMIVYDKPSRDDEHDSLTHEAAIPSAPMTLIRMVNRIPLLDGAEACACGLVQSLASKQSLWTSFGLSVRSGLDETANDLRLFAPTYEIRDSDHVASFFQHRNPHQLFDLQNMNCETDDGVWMKAEGDEESRTSAILKQSIPLLPAHLRLGKVLVIIQINAHPSQLPLPTLSKSRLPLNHAAIDKAVEAGLKECLRSLQTTNPCLLLTPSQIRTSIRDTRYIPLTAASLACIICKSKDVEFQHNALTLILKWSSGNLQAINHEEDELDLAAFSITKLGPLLEKKLRFICSEADKNKTSTKRVKRQDRIMTRSRSGTSKGPPPCLLPYRDVSWSSAISSQPQTFVEPRSAEGILQQRESLGSLFSQGNNYCGNILQLAHKTSEGSLDMAQSLSSSERISNSSTRTEYVHTIENSTLFLESIEAKNSLDVSQTSVDNNGKVDAIEW